MATVSTKGQALTRRQSLVQALVSSTAAAATAIMAGEFLADILHKRNNMPVPKWMKPWLWLACTILVSVEANKVREDFQSFWEDE